MSKFKTKGTIVIELMKNLGFSFLALLIGGYIVYSTIGDTFITYLLSNYGEVTKGQINDVTEDATDKDGGGVFYTFYYDYTFKVSDKPIHSGGSADGRIPNEFSNATEEPVQVDVVYMKANPQINRLKMTLDASASYLVKRSLFALIVIAFTLYFVILNGKPVIKNCLEDFAYHKQVMKEDASLIPNKRLI